MKISSKVNDEARRFCDEFNAANGQAGYSYDTITVEWRSACSGSPDEQKSKTITEAHRCEVAADSYSGNAFPYISASHENPLQRVLAVLLSEEYEHGELAERSAADDEWLWQELDEECPDGEPRLLPITQTFHFDRMCADGFKDISTQLMVESLYPDLNAKRGFGVDTNTLLKKFETHAFM